MIHKVKLVWHTARKIALYYQRKPTYQLRFAGHFQGRTLCPLSPIDLDKLVRDGARILQGEYQIYNFPAYAPVQWKRCPVTGVQMPKHIHCAFLRVSHLYNRADVKNFWEQSHLHPLLTLAQCYVHTKEERYAQGAVELICHWKQENPVGCTVNWKCNMDNAIRISNVVESLSHIRSSGAFQQHRLELGQFVRDHLVYLPLYYENTGEKPNNHYLSNLVGTLFAGVYLSQEFSCQQAERCVTDGLSRLEKEMTRQVDEGGFDYEYSTYYHCFVTELFAETLRMLRDNQVSYSVAMEETVQKMLQLCNMLGAFSGNLILMGDQDSSRLFHWQGCFDVNRCDFSSIASYWNRENPARASLSGIYRLQQGNMTCFLKCGEIGTAQKGTHDHNDQLSVSILCDGIPIVWDSGSYCYTNDQNRRRAFRSTKAHSTVYFGDKEQNGIDELFSMTSCHKGTLLEETPQHLTASFSYGDQTTHKRKLSILEGSTVEIVDEAPQGVSRLILPCDMSQIKQVTPFELLVSMENIIFSIQSTTPLNQCVHPISSTYGVMQTATAIDAPVPGIHTYYITKREASTPWENMAI